jgi:hypothetical protein
MIYIYTAFGTGTAHFSSHLLALMLSLRFHSYRSEDDRDQFLSKFRQFPCEFIQPSYLPCLLPYATPQWLSDLWLAIDMTTDLLIVGCLYHHLSRGKTGFKP